MKHIQLEMPSSYKVAFFGDLHYAVVGYPDKTVKRAMDRIKAEKNYFVATGGDMIDCMKPQDSRYVHGQYPGKLFRVMEQIKGVKQELEPIGDRIKWGVTGNHEFRYINEIDVTKDILEHFNCNVYDEGEDSSWMMIAQLNDIIIAQHHGKTVPSSKAGSTQQRITNGSEMVKRRLRELPGDDCEAIIAHHIHRMHIAEPTTHKMLKFTNQGGELKSFYPEISKKYLPDGRYYYDDDDRWYATSGGFMPTYSEGFSGYGERKIYRPTEMGYIYLEVKNDKLIKIDKEIF